MDESRPGSHGSQQRGRAQELLNGEARPRLARLLVLRPQPRSDRFFDVGESVLRIRALRETARQRWTLRYHPSILIRPLA